MTESISLPPHSAEAEQAVLGSLMIDRDAIAIVAESLKPEAFYLGVNSTIYRAMLALWQVRRPCDVVTLAALLDSRGKLDDVGGLAYLSSFLDITPTAAHLEHYANIVNEHARRRALIVAGSEMVQLGYRKGPEPDYDQVVVDARSSISGFDPLDKPAGDQIGSLVEELRDLTFRRWDNQIHDEVFRTRIDQLDAMTDGGMRRRELWIYAARPSMGKSSLMLHTARHQRAVIFSLEMPRDRILNRMIAAEAGVPYAVATTIVGDVRQRDRWIEASEKIEKLPIMLIDSPGMTTAKIESITARAVAEQGVDVIYIDHLNYLFDQFRYSNEQEKTGELVRRCKHIADAQNVTVVLLSQLNREAETRTGCMPHMADLRSSGRIEEDADFVGLLYRRLYYVGRGMLDGKPELDWVPNTQLQKVQFMVAKNRNGDTGTALLGWEAPSMKFHEAAA